MRDEAWPIRRCVWCKTPFSARTHQDKQGRPKWQTHCSRVCARATVNTFAKGRIPEQAIIALREKRARVYKAKMEKQFGELSDREIELIRVVDKRAYDRGYNAAYQPLRKHA